MLISLGNKPLTSQVIQALIILSEQENLAPILVLDKLNQDRVTEAVRLRHPVEFSDSYASEHLSMTPLSEPVDLESIIEAIATRILPPSLSMEELLNYIHEALIANQ